MYAKGAWRMFYFDLLQLFPELYKKYWLSLQYGYFKGFRMY